jgi:hypothetical protein
VIGCIAVARRRVWLAGLPREVAFIQDLRVRTTHRRQGVANALLTWARSRTAETLGRTGIAIAASLAAIAPSSAASKARGSNPSSPTRAPFGFTPSSSPACLPPTVMPVSTICASRRGTMLAALWDRIGPGRELAPVLDERELSRIFELVGAQPA